MRIGIAAALGGCILAGSFLAPTNPAEPAPEISGISNLIAQIESADPNRIRVPAADGFFLESAVWEETDRGLVVRARTNAENGMLLTLTGLPDSTWVDAFRVSSGHAVDYALQIPVGRAVPCQVAVHSAAVSAIISIVNAPLACDNVLGIDGIVTADAGLPMAGALVTVTVGETVFSTVTDAAGAYSLEIYSASSDEPVTIVAEGIVGSEQVELYVYEGSILKLQGKNLRGSVWAREIFGRRMTRRMLAATAIAADRPGRSF